MDETLKSPEPAESPSDAALDTLTFAARCETLGRTSICATLPPRTIEALARIMEENRHPEGGMLVQKGQPSPQLYVLVSGRAEVGITGEDGKPVIAAILGEGDCFGEMSLLSGDSASADVVVQPGARTLSLDRKRFNALVASHPSLLRDFIRMMSRRLTSKNIEARRKELEMARFLQDSGLDRKAILVGNSTETKRLKKRIEEAAASNAPCFIEGEAGAGKVVVSQMIHVSGARSSGPFIRVDCARITVNPQGDQLFGARGGEEARAELFQAVCYMDLAEGGTILLERLDGLLPEIQERLAAYLEYWAARRGGEGRNVRVIATSRTSLTDKISSPRIHPLLISLFAENLIVIPPIRSRKRDIPDLAQHFLAELAEKYQKPLTGFSVEAMNKLVSHDYSQGNTRELRETIERAVICAENPEVTAEEIFLGQFESSDSGGFNLVKSRGNLQRLLLRAHPVLPRIATIAVFGAILWQCFLGPAGGNENWGNYLVWSLWWPLLILSFFFLGRAWCGICPISGGGGVVRRLSGLNWTIPSWLKENDGYVATAGFVAIVLAEEGFGMRHHPRATGLLLLTIISGYLTAGWFFPRRAWCRHLCPLGGLAGVIASTGMLEVAPTHDICSAKCKGHDCYKGTAAAEGCPMFQHVMFLDSSQHCVVCLNCVKSCPNHSPRLNLRVPFRELWGQAIGTPKTTAFVVAAMGLLLVQIIVLLAERTRAWPLFDEHRFMTVLALVIIFVFLPLRVLHWTARRSRPLAGGPTEAVFWRKIVAWLPILLAGLVCYQLTFLPGLGHIHLGAAYSGFARPFAVTIPILAGLDFLLLTSGLIVMVIALWRIGQELGDGRLTSWVRSHAVSIFCGTAYWALLLVLFLRFD